MIISQVNTQEKKQEDITFDQFVQKVQKDEVTSLTIKNRDYSGVLTDGNNFKFYGPEDDVDIRALLGKHQVKLQYEEVEENSLWQSILISWLPMLLIFVLFFFFIRQLQSGSGKAMSFAKSKAKLASDKQKVTFKDVAGVDEAKVELEEIVDFLKEPKKFSKLGGKIPKGVLLTGPPGTGKTLLAKAVAGEAGVPFFTISGSDFVEMFVGVGASRVRDLFEQGKKNAPCIIFIDEIDAVGRQRGAGLGGGHDEREQTLNQLLVEMDGFEGNDGIILVAATNRPDVLDPALLRPGRFDRQISVPHPDVRGRKMILEIHSRKKPLADDIDLSIIARGTPGFSGADLANLLNEAALFAARQNASEISTDHLELAKDKVLMGVERRSMVISDKEKLNTAYHEAGHAIVGRDLEDKGGNSDPIHKVTIIPRGRALGVTISLPREDRLSMTTLWCHSRIQILMAGRIAEEIIFGDVTSGASNDFKVATNLAHSMVCEWGMSDMGPVAFSAGDDSVFLGRELTRHKSYSEQTAIEIDAEIKKIITTNYAKAKQHLLDHIDQLHVMAKVLMVEETIDRDMIDRIHNNDPINDVLDRNDLPEIFKTLSPTPAV